MNEPLHNGSAGPKVKFLRKETEKEHHAGCFGGPNGVQKNAVCAIFQWTVITSSGPRFLLSDIWGQDKNLIWSEKKCCLLGGKNEARSCRNNLGEGKAPGSVLKLGFIFWGTETHKEALLAGISRGPPWAPLWKCKLYVSSPSVRASCIVWKQLEVFFHLDLTTSDTRQLWGGVGVVPSWSSTVNYLNS